jgi:hypothetical protein
MRVQPPKSVVEFSGTIYGSFDYQFEGNGAWVGHAILAIGGKPPLKAAIVDRNDSFERSPDGGVSGTETIRMSFPDGTFDISGAFTAASGPTPGLWRFHETGWIGNGTGVYKDVSGHVVLYGPGLVPDPGMTPGAPLWISEMHGILEGLP